MNRRGFLGLFSGAAAALVLDPERALWIPGKKLVSIPKPMVGVTTEQLQFIINEFRGNIYQDNVCWGLMGLTESQRQAAFQPSYGGNG